MLNTKEWQGKLVKCDCGCCIKHNTRFFMIVSLKSFGSCYITSIMWPDGTIETNRLIESVFTDNFTVVS